MYQEEYAGKIHCVPCGNLNLLCTIASKAAVTVRHRVKVSDRVSVRLAFIDNMGHISICAWEYQMEEGYMPWLVCLNKSFVVTACGPVCTQPVSAKKQNKKVRGKSSLLKINPEWKDKYRNHLLCLCYSSMFCTFESVWKPRVRILIKKASQKGVVTDWFLWFWRGVRNLTLHQKTFPQVSPVFTNFNSLSTSFQKKLFETTTVTSLSNKHLQEALFMKQASLFLLNRATVSLLLYST